MSNKVQTSPEVLAVTVTFNPDIEVLRRQLDSLSTQCCVVLVDNGSHVDKLDQIESLNSEFDHCSLICLEENMGIACAQNAGIKHGIESTGSYRYVLTLDHDSVPDKGMVRQLSDGAQFLQNQAIRIAAIGPVLLDPRSGHVHKLHKISGPFWKKVVPMPGGEPIEVDSLNSSGSLIGIDVLREIGLFKEEMFIDMVEGEWCFRAMSQGYRFYVHQSVVMEHSMGDDVVELNGLIRLKMPYRSPQRHYYIFRNAIFLQKQKYVPSVWKFWNIIKLIFTYFYFGFFSDDAKSQRREMRKGLVAGISNQSGQRT